MIKYFPSIHGLDVCLSRGVGNLNNKYELLAWMRKCEPYVEEFMVDSGVHKLFKLMRLKDYPREYVVKYYNMVSYIAKMFRDIRFYAVVPDVPSDYDENVIPDNIEKTVRWIEDYLEHQYLHSLENVEVIAVVQGRKDSISSVVNAYLRYRDLYNKFRVLGLGPTCHTKSVKKLSSLIMTFDRVVDRGFHVFGPNLRALKVVIPRVKRMVSFDSSSFFIDPNGRLHTRRTRGERLLQFIEEFRGLGVTVPRVVS